MGNKLLVFYLLFPISAWALECPTGTHHVRRHHRRAYQRADGTSVSATTVSESCRTSTSADVRWADKLKSGMPSTWEHKEESTAKWTEEERERVLEAFAEIPEALWDPDMQIYRLSKSAFFPNPASQLGHAIALYDTAFDSNQTLSRVLAHELAHSAFDHLSGAEKKSYRDSTGWEHTEISGDDIFWKVRPGEFVAEDGRNGPREDFANNVEHYLFDPKVLKEKTPSAYDWIKRQYGDKFSIKGRAK